MAAGPRTPAPAPRPRGAVPALVFAAAFLGAAPVFAQVFSLNDYSGHELFQQFCAACHGAGGRGDGPVAGTLNVVVPDLTRLSAGRANRFPAGEVRETIDGRSLVIAHGTRRMPVWGYEFWVEEGADVTAEAEVRSILDKLVEYVESLQIDPGPAGAPR